MKKKLVEANPPKKVRRKGNYATVQLLDDEILVVNFWEDKKLLARHCLNVNTHEYASLRGDEWCRDSIIVLLGYGDKHSYLYYYDRLPQSIIKSIKMSKEDSELILSKVEAKYCDSPLNSIADVESEYRFAETCKREKSKQDRIDSLMSQIPDIDNFEIFVDKAFAAAYKTSFIMRNPKTREYTCYACHKEVDIPKGTKNRSIIKCPCCHKEVEFLKLKKTNSRTISIGIVQPIDDSKSVVRYYRISFEVAGNTIDADALEEIRMILYKRNETYKPRKDLEIYYNSFWNGWSKSNPENKQWYRCLLINLGIQEAFKDTNYERWARIFETMSAAGYMINYNRLMSWIDPEAVELTEMLFKGRFYNLLADAAGYIYYWSGEMSLHSLELNSKCIEDVFKLSDRQLINRIRDNDGDILMLRWFQWAERHCSKISDKVLNWLNENYLEPEDMAWISCRFSLEQAVNYIERQRKESYKGKTARQVISQYEDYMNMAKKLNRDTTDAMIYKPRDLKKFHDMYVIAIEQQAAKIQAEEYSKKYPEAESVLGEIKNKLEYQGKDYFIMVPNKIVDIVTEGRCLHHCVGSTDRYFDRIKCHETYICFLRKQEAPDEPFYTIEVEPGGTIRQHRGLYDEEPDLDTVKPFLVEWQKEIKKRMRKEDHERAAVSKIKREENIEELKAKGNTRVLDGLLEDFMEAI